jgi:cyclopropane-fatty-acyl-phospholipid synthase
MRFPREVLGLGDSHVDGWWECGALDQFFDRILRAGVPGLASVKPGAKSLAARCH